MANINLRDIYPHYKNDTFVEVPDELADALRRLASTESAYQRRTYRNKAFFSLDRNDGLEEDAVLNPSPEEVFERKVTKEQLYTALAALPDKQAKRVYAFFFLGMSVSEIANAENVSPRAIRQVLERGIRALRKKLKKNN